MKLRMNGPYRDLVALIQFGNQAYVVTPFTTDYENILLSIRLVSDPRDGAGSDDWGTTIIEGIDQGDAAVQDVRLRERLRQSDGGLHRRARQETDARATSALDQLVAEARRARIPVYMIRTAFNCSLAMSSRTRSGSRRSSAPAAASIPRPTTNDRCARCGEIDRLSAGRDRRARIHRAASAVRRICAGRRRAVAHGGNAETGLSVLPEFSVMQGPARFRASEKTSASGTNQKVLDGLRRLRSSS